MQMRAFVAAPVLALALLWPGAAWSQAPPEKQCITLELFVRDGVQACTDAHQFAQELVKRNGFLRVVVHDVLDEPEQMARVKELSAKYGVAPSVPTFFVCNRLMAGFNANTGREIEDLCCVTVFTRDGCPRCAAAKEYLVGFKQKYPGLPVHDYEVTRTPGARDRMQALTSRAKASAASMPTFYAGGRILIGWSDGRSGADLERVLKPHIVPWPAGKPALEGEAPQPPAPAAKEPEKQEEPKKAALHAPRTLSVRGWAGSAIALTLPARTLSGAFRLATPAALVLWQAAPASAPLEPPAAEPLEPPAAAPLEPPASAPLEPPAAAPLEPGAAPVEPLEPRKAPLDPNAVAAIPAAPLDPSGVLEPLVPLEPLEPLDPSDPQSPGAEEPQDIIHLPYLGDIRASDLGMPMFTIAVGLIDGFNPCAMWVLIFLLSVLVNLKDRWKIVLIAGTFVLVSGLAYFAFMAAWLSIFWLIDAARPVQIALGVVATVAGAIHVKDFFAFKQGVSLSIPESAKPGIYKRVRAIVQSNQIWAALAGAVTLAVLVNMVELLCTAGLPAMYTQILTMQGYPSWKNYLYLALYNVAYMFDDSVLLAIIVTTMSHRRLQEKEGRWLKFVSGAVMVGLGLTMLFKPEWLG